MALGEPLVIVRELELDLDAFEGPFDLLLTLVLREELELAEVDVSEIVLAFCERLEERGRLDLDACGEFLVLVAALLELKARGLFPDEEAERCHSISQGVSQSCRHGKMHASGCSDWLVWPASAGI